MKTYKKNEKHLLNVSLMVLLVISLFSSCYKERLGFDKISGSTSNPNVAAPLFYGSVGVDNIVEEGNENLKVDPDGMLSLVYVGDTFDNFTDPIVEINNQSLDTSLQFILPPGISQGEEFSKIFNFYPSLKTDKNERVDSVLIKSGKFTIEVTSSLNQDGYIEFIIPNFSRYGVTFMERIYLNYTGGSSVSGKVTVDLTDYKLKLNQGNGIVNQIEEYVKVFVTKGSVADNSPYNIDIKQTVESVSYNQIFGYFSQYKFDVNETAIPITFFDNQLFAKASIEAPEMRFNFYNSYGIPIEITFDELYVESNGVKKDITSTLLPSLALDYPDYNDVGNTTTTDFVFNSSNSNIKEVVSFKPDKFLFKGKGLTNPKEVYKPNFATQESYVGLHSEVEIPLYGSALDFTLEDTVDVSFDENFNWERVETANLNISTLNRFPLDAYLQMYLLDSNDIVIDSIFESKEIIISSAIVGSAPQYRVETPMHQLTKVTLTPDKFSSLASTKKIIFSVIMNTYDNGAKTVKIYNDYDVNYEVAFKTKFKLDLQ